MRIVFYGPEGSGKGTQAKLLASELGLPLITTGDLVRNAAANDSTKLGNLCRQSLSEGKYLPDEDVSLLLQKKLKEKEVKKGFILDGFPRTVRQAKFLDETLGQENLKLNKFIYLKLTDEESVRRLSLRKRTLFQGSKILHDDPVRVKQRLLIYRSKENDVLKYYKSKKLILEVDAAKTIAEIFENIKSGLGIGR